MFSVPAYFPRAISVVIIATATLLLASCGGGALNVTPSFTPTPADWPGHDWEQGVKAGAFTVVAVDETERSIAPLNEYLALELADSGSAPRVRIRGEDLPASSEAFLHLQYDAAQFHPVNTKCGDELTQDAVFLGITSMPGVVTLGLAKIAGKSPLAGDLVLAEVEFAPGAFAVSRQASLVAEEPVTDLRFNTSNRETLEWTYLCIGDYDQNSEVNVADITPIGMYYKATTQSGNWQEAQVADGDENTEVNIADLTPIGNHYLQKAAQYIIKGGASASGPFVGGDTIQLSESVVPTGGGFRRFSYQVPTPVEGAWYVVVASDGQLEAAQHSNAAQYHAEVQLLAPQNLTASVEESTIVLNWDAPTGVIPDGYEAYVGSTDTLGDAMKLNVGIIEGTTYSCPVSVSPDNEHYFGVRAYYATTPPQTSGFSNIYHYQPGSSDVPSGLVAERAGDVIELSWTAPAGSTPDSYNAYFDDASDMDGAEMINTAPITDTDYTCPLAVDADSEHYFGIKAVYGTEESAYSNIYQYSPVSDTDPPVWDDQVGIKSAYPSDSQVMVEWYDATDSESPPVTYVIYYDLNASFDWATASTVTASESEPNKIIGDLSNGQTYCFGVRARDALGNTDTNTNTLTAAPIAGGVPVDTGVWQSSELVDTGGEIATQDVGWFSDIAVASDGTIGIAHHNETSGDLMYSELAGGSGTWSTVTISSQGQTGAWPSLAYDPVTGYPCIAYHNEDEASLWYAEYDGNQWENIEVESGGDKGAFASLAFDPNDNEPAIAYFDAVNLDVRYAKRSGTAWSAQLAYNGTPGGTNLTGAFCSLAFNPATGHPGIAFMRTYDESSIQMHACWITEWSGTSWDAEAAYWGPYADIFIDTAGWANSLCYSDTGTAYIITVELMGEVYLATDGAGGWDPLTATAVGDTGALAGEQTEKIYTDIEYYDGSLYWVYFDRQGAAIDFGKNYGQGSAIEASGNGGFPALAIDTNGDLYASYLDNTGGVLRYAVSTNDGAAWTPAVAENGVGGEGVVGERASLGFHPTGSYPMISYYDASNTALKFSDRQPGSWRNETVSNIDNDGGASALGVATTTGTAYIGYFAISSTHAALKLATGSFGDWQFQTLIEADFTSGGDVVGNYCALGMNYPPTEAPSLAYHNTSQRRVEFAQGDTGGGFEMTTVYEFNDPGRWNSVAFNPANKFAGLAFYVRDSQDLYFVQRAGSGAWVPVPVDTAGMVGNRCSLCYGADTARPWISYYDEGNKRLKVAYVPTGVNWDDGGAWQFVNIPAPDGSTDYGSFSSIAWHPVYNRPAVAFYDTSAGKLWYVFIGDPANPQPAVQVVGEATNEGTYPSMVFHSATGQPSIAYHDATNGDLRYVWREP